MANPDGQIGVFVPFAFIGICESSADAIVLSTILQWTNINTDDPLPQGVCWYGNHLWVSKTHEEWAETIPVVVSTLGMIFRRLKKQGYIFSEAHRSKLHNDRVVNFVRLNVRSLPSLDGYAYQVPVRELPDELPKLSKRARLKAGCVYLIRSDVGYYKIGRTVNPDNRITTFAVKLPFDVDYICVIETPDMYGLERELHQRFASKRVNGEWFALNDDDVAHIKSLVGKRE